MAKCLSCGTVFATYGGSYGHPCPICRSYYIDTGKEGIIKPTIVVNPELADRDWEHFGYPSSEPCVVCGATEDTKSEPRFNYTVCRAHAHIAPVDINKYKK